MKVICTLFAVALIMLTGVSTSSAQSPDGQFGVGIIAGSSYGGYLAYALTPAWHIGTGVGLRVQSNNNQFYVGPYAKFLMSGTKELKPFILAQFMIMSDAAVSDDGTATAATSLGFAAGAEYFITPNFGLAGSITVLSLGFTPSVTTFGLMNGNLMAEWFFD